MNLEEAKAAINNGQRVRDWNGDEVFLLSNGKLVYGMGALEYRETSADSDFSLIDPEPEKEEKKKHGPPGQIALCPRGHLQTLPGECPTCDEMKPPTRKTSGLTREEAYEAAKAGALVKAMKPEVPHLVYRAGGHELEFFEESLGWIGAKHDCFTATYPEAPKPEEKKEELKTFGGKMFAMLDNLPEAPKPEPIELGDELNNLIIRHFGTKNRASEQTVKFGEFSEALISRILEIVGERR